ncbi:MAG TPA: hypothetical protein VD735_02780 [Candidatus Saccharimonadales bacterium]|nr:hypothetical protein [Candidatus Saccharimonadales bacterium]
MEREKPVKITLSGKLSYQDDLTVNQAAQILAFIETSASMEVNTPATAARLAPLQATTATIRTRLTPREALESSGAKTNPEKITAFASTMLDDNHEGTFSLEDIRSLFQRARETTPKNLSRDFEKVIQVGWVDESEDNGKYYLTTKGLDALEAGFKAQGSKKTSGRTARKSSPKAIATPEVFKNAGVDELPTTIEGYPTYTKLTNNKDRLIWALLLASTLKINSLNNQEIVWLTDHLGVGIHVNNMGASYSYAHKAGLVNRSIQDDKTRLVMPQAGDYLKNLSSTAEK